MSASDKEKIVSIMRENSRHAYFATCNRDQPFVRPVSPIVEDDMSIWVTTFYTSRKVNKYGSILRFVSRSLSNLVEIKLHLSLEMLK